MTEDMTYTYTVSDFDNLPSKALKALGLRTINDNSDVVAINHTDDMVVINHKEFCECLPPNAAAALLIGMVQQHCWDICVKLVVVENGIVTKPWDAVVGEIKHPGFNFEQHNKVGYCGCGRSPLSAVLAAYRAALEARQ